MYKFGDIVMLGSPILDAIYNDNTTKYAVICDYNKDTDLYLIYIQNEGLRYYNESAFRDNRDSLTKALSKPSTKPNILEDDKYKDNPNINRIKEIFEEVGL